MAELTTDLPASDCPGPWDSHHVNLPGMTGASGSDSPDDRRPSGWRQADCEIPDPPQLSSEFNPVQRLFLLQLARSALEEAVHRRHLPAPDPAQIDKVLLQPRACFVTLEKHGELRGCIGHLIARQPLYSGVIENARSAALADPRFPSVAADELEAITIEISVLSMLRPLDYRSETDLLPQLRPFRDGVVFQDDDRMATFLPQVWEQIPAKADFLDRLAAKGGWEPCAWREGRIRVSVYEVEAFPEGPRSG